MRKISEMPFSDRGHVLSWKKANLHENTTHRLRIPSAFPLSYDLYLEFLAKFGDDRDRSQSRELVTRETKSAPDNNQHKVYLELLEECCIVRPIGFSDQIYHQEHNQ